MDTKCSACNGTGSSGGITCLNCDGTGLVGLTDPAFKQITLGDQITLTGVVWDSILTRLSDIEGKLDDVMDKCNDIFENLPGQH